MSTLDYEKCKQKYEWYRHHAWAGLGILSIVVTIRFLIPLPNWFLFPVISILVIYVVTALIGTYRYSSAILTSGESINRTELFSLDLEPKRLETKMDKVRLKLEKKKTKAAYKAQKKMEKKK
ncbi:MAG TPA: hypothetical protein EYP23_04140 [Thermoplasmata archaeon]|nr:hypothetical protein [Thermoplasmata archaeon]